MDKVIVGFLAVLFFLIAASSGIGARDVYRELRGGKIVMTSISPDDFTVNIVPKDDGAPIAYDPQIPLPKVLKRSKTEKRTARREAKQYQPEQIARR